MENFYEVGWEPSNTPIHFALPPVAVVFLQHLYYITLLEIQLNILDGFVRKQCPHILSAVLRVAVLHTRASRWLLFLFFLIIV
jgi:hypothetical protein